MFWGESIAEKQRGVAAAMIVDRTECAVRAGYSIVVEREELCVTRKRTADQISHACALK